MAFLCRHLHNLSVLDHKAFKGACVRYAPTPRLIFSPKLSALKASVIPRIASGGPCWTLLQVDAYADRTIDETCLCRATTRAAGRSVDNMLKDV